MPADDGGFDTGNPAGFIKGLLAEGESATSGLSIFREFGGTIRDSRWYSLYSQVSDTVAREPAMLALDPFTLPSPSDYGEWSTMRPGQFASQVEIQVIDRDTGIWYTKQHTYITDEPHTPAEAESDAFAMFGDPETENSYGETVMGALTVHLWKTVGYAEGV